MPCVIASASDLALLRAEVEANPATLVTIDVVALRVRSAGGLDFPVTMPASAREALVSGRWDPIQELLDNEPAIMAKAAELNYL
jgi:3-isopropylmalate/(R)-2-methylmalate dehydratase small subunit